MVRIDSALNAVFDTLAEMADRNSKHVHPKGASIGFWDIDVMTAGIWPGELMCVAGPPGVGKTAFALNVAVNAAKAGVKVLLFELEGSAEATTLRIIASEGRIPLAKLRRGRMDSDDWESIGGVLNNLHDLDLHICNDPLLSLDTVKTVTQQFAELGGRTLIVLDAPQAASPEWCRALKETARTLDVPALMTAPFARELDTAERADLNEDRFSRDLLLGLIGEPARVSDAIILLTGDGDEDDSYRSRALVADVFVAKNRGGSNGKLKLVFLKETMQFVDYAEDASEARR